MFCISWLAVCPSHCFEALGSRLLLPRDVHASDLAIERTSPSPTRQRPAQLTNGYGPKRGQSLIGLSAVIYSLWQAEPLALWTCCLQSGDRVGNHTALVAHLGLYSPAPFVIDTQSQWLPPMPFSSDQCSCNIMGHAHRQAKAPTLSEDCW